MSRPFLTGTGSRIRPMSSGISTSITPISAALEPEGVATQLARQLADPRPADARTIQQLGRYKNLDMRWADWTNVTEVCRCVAVEMVQ